jgi:hypothetical protein
MTHSLLHVRALGATVAIDVTDPRLRPLALQAWSACATSPVDGCPVVQAPTVLRGASSDDVAVALQTLTQLVTREAIGARAGQLMMFHAGALCDQTSGATIAMVAPGGTGKTTLVRTLGHGRGYISDETVAVADDLSIEPYCKPLSIRRPDTGLPKDEVNPADLGLTVPRVQPWLAGIVLLRRDRAEGAPTVVEPVDVLDALVLLAPETSSLARVERPLHRLAGLVQAVGGLLRVRYHDAVEVEPVVRDILGRSR